MEPIGKVYRFGEPKKQISRSDLTGLEKCLKDEGFRLVESVGESREFWICDGGDILDCERHIAGYIDKGCIYTKDSPRLDKFLSELDF